MSEPPAATDSESVDQPKRRRWKRWVALAFVLALACGVWLISGESPTARRGRQLRPGQTVAEVEAIVGLPIKIQKVAHTSRGPFFELRRYGTRTDQLIYDFKDRVHQWARRFGVKGRVVVDRNPAMVEFDAEGRVQRVYIEGRLVQGEPPGPPRRTK